MKNTLLVGAALACVQSVASAQVFDPPVSDWTGVYAGQSSGSIDAETYVGSASPDAFSASNALGGFLGFQIQGAQMVFGGEVAFTVAPDAQLGTGATLDPTIDIKLRAGYAIDNFLPYAVLGIAFAGFEDGGTSLNSMGASYGIGADYRLTEALFIGGEYHIRRTFDYDPADNTYLNVDTFSIRAGFKF